MHEAVLDYLLNTGQLPNVRSLSITRRASLININASSPGSAHAAPVEMTNVTGHSSVNGTTTSVNEKSTVM